jgi:Effector Associated Constant Component 1
MEEVRMVGASMSLQVQIASRHDSDEEELDRVAQGLRGELLDLDVESVKRAPVAVVPDDAKGSGASVPDLLIISISNSTVLVAIMHLLQGWIARGKDRKVTVKIGKNSLEIDAASPEEQAKLIESWIDWHAKH